ncbi:MAG: hypothetical protein P1U36_00995 [Legionellaceae bacterium]|nr:hypothetical protein [Legionellaceae bacterium]
MTQKKLLISIYLIIFSTLGFGAKALYSVEQVIPAASKLPSNRSSSATYRVCNQSPISQTLTTLPITGITPITTTTDACTSPFTLTPNACCLLNLRLRGNEIITSVKQGPVVCKTQSKNNHAADKFACSQPNYVQSFNTKITPEVANQNSWISVLVAQNAPPDDLQTYVNNIKHLAPSLEQIHLRFDAGASNYQMFVDLIAMLRTAYSDSLLIGFHPDNSNGSYSNWGCTSPDWACVLNKSIIAMNQINAQADPSQKGLGFNIFSIEQSYVEPQTPEGYATVKACLNPKTADPSATCPAGVTIASQPYVSYGNVLPSYGAAEQYGPTMLDYGYPQYYNLGKHLPSTYSALVTASTPYFPAYSAANCLATPTLAYPYNIVDVDTPGAYPQPKIPCFSNTPNVYTYTNPPTVNGPSPTLASAYLAYLMTQLEPILPVTPAVVGATVFITLSGEPDFLGAPGWSLDKLSEFNQNLNNNFSRLKTEFPSLFPEGGEEPSNIKYAIWNFEDMLNNNPA